MSIYIVPGHPTTDVMVILDSEGQTPPEYIEKYIFKISVCFFGKFWTGFLSPETNFTYFGFKNPKFD